MLSESPKTPLAVLQLRLDKPSGQRPITYDIDLTQFKGRNDVLDRNNAIVEVRRATPSENGTYNAAKGRIGGDLYAVCLSEYNGKLISAIGFQPEDLQYLTVDKTVYIDLRPGRDLKALADEAIADVYQSSDGDRNSFRHIAMYQDCANDAFCTADTRMLTAQ